MASRGFKKKLTIETKKVGASKDDCRSTQNPRDKATTLPEGVKKDAFFNYVSKKIANKKKNREQFIS